MKKSMTYLFLFCSILCLCDLSVYAAADAAKSSYSSKEVDLKTSTRRLFADYLTWERIFAVETITSAQDAAKAQARMLQGQDAVNSLFKTYFGDSSGSQVTTLFNQYIGLITDYVNAAKNRGDTVSLINKIHDKTDEIAGNLSMTNMNWSKDDLSSQLKNYSDSFLKEIDLQSSTAGSIDTKLFDATCDLSMQLADTFSSGIVQQNPGKFW
jgi:hypothetical protein